MKKYMSWIIILFPASILLFFIVRYTINTFGSLWVCEPTSEAISIDSTRGKCHLINDAIMNFYIDINRYPANLQELTVANAKDLSSPVQEFHGPYLKTIPPNPLVGQHIGKKNWIPDPVMAHNWKYDPKTGEVLSAVPDPAPPLKYYTHRLWGYMW